MSCKMFCCWMLFLLHVKFLNKLTSQNKLSKMVSFLFSFLICLLKLIWPLSYFINL